MSYFIGLDFGTESCGWAVMDEKFNLVKKQGKHLWGVSLFEGAKVCADTRKFRGSKRRLRRRGYRISKLNEMFAQEIAKIDREFFIRLKYSFVANADKDNAVNRYEKILFNDASYTDKNFYDDFPTIYHLREYLCSGKSDKYVDIRHIYLAIHHIIKYRGNFLHEGDLKFEGKGVRSAFEDVFEKFSDVCDIPICFKKGEDTFEVVKKSLVDKTKYKKHKKEDIQNNLKSVGKVAKTVSEAVMGSNFSLNDLFNTEEFFEQGEAIKINFADDSYLEKEDSLASSLGDKMEAIYALKNLYSVIQLQNILGDKQFICQAMVEKYNTHKEQLEMLKNLLKSRKKEYLLFFENNFENQEQKDNAGKSTLLANYANYIISTDSVSKGSGKDKKFGLPVMYEYLKELLGSITDFSENELKTKVQIFEQMENKSFLSKLNIKDNAEIPNQLHANELELILKNYADMFETLKNDEVRDKIMTLSKCCIPYYVGPLSANPSKNCQKFTWMIKKAGMENVSITPWNLNEVVDKLQTAEKFIRRMTNKCTYLSNVETSEEVLAKNSLIYQYYEVLYELNNIRVDGKPLPVELKQKAFAELFLKHKKVSKSAFEKWLIANNFNVQGDVTGFQKKDCFASSLSSLIYFRDEVKLDVQKDFGIIEDLIKWSTIFEDREIFVDKAKSEFGEKFSENQFSMLKKKRFKGWGRLSKQLLVGLKSKCNHGSYANILQLMWETQNNFMQLIKNKEKYDFSEHIKKYQGNIEGGKIEYSHIKELSGSPALKRSIWQGVKIVKEIIKTMNGNPARVYIEVAKDDQSSVRTTSREKALNKGYAELIKMLKEANNDDESSRTHKIKKQIDEKREKLREEKMYLYFTQNGKCMYSGESLDIDKLSQYQVDHIIPRSYFYDDGIENKVLVKTQRNQDKADELFISRDVVGKCGAFWKYLKDCNLISKKKYASLTRVPDVEKFREQCHFLNRQLVETRQITKHFANLLGEKMGLKVSAIKSGMVSAVREKYELYKSRDINDCHHAHDAFLCMVVGRFAEQKFPFMQEILTYKDYASLRYAKYFKNWALSKKSGKKYGFIADAMSEPLTDVDGVVVERDGEPVWNEKTFPKIMKVFDSKDPLIVKQKHQNRGQFYAQTLYKAKAKKSLLPLNSVKPVQLLNGYKDDEERLKSRIYRGNVDLYGGYSNDNTAYMVGARFKDKGVFVNKIVDVPIRIAYQIEKGKESIEEYVKKQFGSDAIIIKDKILLNQLVKIDGCRIYLKSEKEKNNAVQLFLSRKNQKLAYEMEHGKIDFQSETLESRLNEFITEYIQKLKTVYPVHSSIVGKIECCYRSDKYNKATMQEKCAFAKDLLKITRARPGRGVRFIGGEFGRLRIKNEDILDMVFIDQSVTGLHKTVTKGKDLIKIALGEKID